MADIKNTGKDKDSQNILTLRKLDDICLVSYITGNNVCNVFLNSV